MSIMGLRRVLADVRRESGDMRTAPGTGNREPFARNREPGTWNYPGTGNLELSRNRELDIMRTYQYNYSNMNMKEIITKK